MDAYTAHLRALLAELPTTAGQDEEALAQDAALRARSSASPTSPRTVVLTPRVAAAVRARLEFKRVVGEGLWVLEAYQHHLERGVWLPGGRP